MVVKNKFSDIELLFRELNTLIAHFKNEQVYNNHEILIGPDSYHVNFDIE